MKGIDGDCYRPPPDVLFDCRRRQGNSTVMIKKSPFTVSGSALAVLMAVNFGFLAVFFLSAAIYGVAPSFLKQA